MTSSAGGDYHHYASGASRRLETTDRETLVEDMVDHGFDRDEAEQSVDRFLQEREEDE